MGLRHTDFLVTLVYFSIDITATCFLHVPNDIYIYFFPPTRWFTKTLDQPAAAPVSLSVIFYKQLRPHQSNRATIWQKPFLRKHLLPVCWLHNDSILPWLSCFYNSGKPTPRLILKSARPARSPSAGAPADSMVQGRPGLSGSLVSNHTESCGWSFYS